MALTGFLTILNFERYYWASQRKKNLKSPFFHTLELNIKQSKEIAKHLPNSYDPLELETILKFLSLGLVGTQRGKCNRLSTPYDDLRNLWPMLTLLVETRSDLWPKPWVGCGLSLPPLGFKVILSSKMGMLCSVHWSYLLERITNDNDPMHCEDKSEFSTAPNRPQAGRKRHARDAFIISLEAPDLASELEVKQDTWGRGEAWRITDLHLLGNLGITAIRCGSAECFSEGNWIRKPYLFQEISKVLAPVNHSYGFYSSKAEMQQGAVSGYCSFGSQNQQYMNKIGTFHGDTLSLSEGHASDVLEKEALYLGGHKTSAWLQVGISPNLSGSQKKMDMNMRQNCGIQGDKWGW